MNGIIQVILYTVLFGVAMLSCVFHQVICLIDLLTFIGRSFKDLENLVLFQ